jgi:hypothetical protein
MEMPFFVVGFSSAFIAPYGSWNLSVFICVYLWLNSSWFLSLRRSSAANVLLIFRVDLMPPLASKSEI